MKQKWNNPLPNDFKMAQFLLNQLKESEDRAWYRRFCCCRAVKPPMLDHCLYHTTVHHISHIYSCTRVRAEEFKAIVICSCQKNPYTSHQSKIGNRTCDANTFQNIRAFCWGCLQMNCLWSASVVGFDYRHHNILPCTLIVFWASCTFSWILDCQFFQCHLHIN